MTTERERRDAIECAVLDREAECDRREPLHDALARIAKATKRTKGAKTDG